MERADDTMLPAAAGVAIWIALVSGSSVLFSLALACATPFAALATVSGLALRRGPALALVGTAWLANQAVGYGLLNYPRTPDSFAWGAAIGIAALAATVSVLALRRCRPASVIGWSAGFALAFAAYEGVLFAATAILPSGDASSPPRGLRSNATGPGLQVHGQRAGGAPHYRRRGQPARAV